jgi:O-antigen/teichoic acid export membrane protein
VKGLARDTAASVGRHVATAVVGLVTMPIIARVLGAQLLGFWSLLGTVAFLLGLCDLGLNAAVLRTAAGEDAAAAKRAARYARTITLALVLPVAAGCVFWMLSIADRLPEGARPSAQIAVFIAVAGGILNAAAQPWRSYAQGRGHILGLARARTAGSLVQLGVTITGLAMHFGLSAVALGYATGMILESFLSSRCADDGVNAGGRASREERAGLRALGRSALVTNVSVALALRVDVVILQEVASLETIAAYSVVSRIVDQGFTLVKQVSAALIPRLGARSRDAEKALSLGTMLLGALAAAPLAVVAVAGRPIVVAWAGHSVDQPILTPVAAWLALAALVAATEEVPASRMSVAGNPRFVAFAICAGSLVNVLVSIGGAYSIGPTAVAAATLLGNLITALLLWRETMRSHGWSSRRVGEVLRPPAIAGSVAALAAFGLSALALPALVAAALAACCGLAASAVAMRAELRGALAAA